MNYSVEFTGGTLVQVQTTKPADVGALRSALQARGIDNAEIQTFGLRSRDRGAGPGRARGLGRQRHPSHGRRRQAGARRHPRCGQLQILRTEAVGPKVGSELRQQAVLAILMSFLAVLAYLAYRFEWRFGVAAVVATAHDVVASLAFIGLARLEVSLFVVAGLLTIVGYSLNDTIVIFDRIRENLHKRKRDSFESVLNRSINETLPRTFFTGTTALGSLAALSVLGGDVVRPFALLMLFGVVVGTFSSIYIAVAGAAVDRDPLAGAGRPGAPGTEGHHHCAAEPQAAACGVSLRRHPERSEGGHAGFGPLHFVQGDMFSSSMLVDTHCHLADPAYDPDRDKVLERAWAAGLAHVVVIGESPAASDRALGLAEPHDRLSVTAGIHPHDASTWTSESATWLRERLRHPRIVAAGEMGLDYHYDHSPRDAQRAAFEAQLALAAETGKPAVIHAREADDDVAAVLRNQPDAVAILHSFSSGPGLLRAGLLLRHYVSFSGMVTFKNWRLDQAILETPLDRLLVETDGPYLAPVPHRGKRNEPAFVRQVAERIAAVRGQPTDEVIARTGENAARVFGLRR